MFLAPAIQITWVPAQLPWFKHMDSINLRFFVNFTCGLHPPM